MCPTNIAPADLDTWVQNHRKPRQLEARRAQSPPRHTTACSHITTPHHLLRPRATAPVTTLPNRPSLQHKHSSAMPWTQIRPARSLAIASAAAPPRAPTAQPAMKTITPIPHCPDRPRLPFRPEDERVELLPRGATKPPRIPRRRRPWKRRRLSRRLSLAVVRVERWGKGRRQLG